MATTRSKKAKALADKASNFVMLAHSYSSTKHLVDSPKDKKRHQVDITSWDVYEKIDGVRAVFKNGKFYSRYGNVFSAPQEFCDLAKTKSNLVLDGELVSISGNFQNTVSIVRDQTTKNSMDYWQDIKYVVFDHQPARVVPFSYRQTIIQTEIVPSDNVQILPRLGIVKTDRSIPFYLEKVEKRGGEGLILRNPAGLYTMGRSWDLLKVKSFIDLEAKVTKHIKGEGKHADRLGKLECVLPSGVTCEVGTGFTDEEREDPPKVGSKITIKYFELSDKGVPRFPVYVGKRDYE
jgi:DNA ligase-1